ncbi:alpha/beta fold hydrolase, partial [Bacteroidota bacterium]
LLHGGPGGDSHTYNTGISYFSDLLEEKFVMVYYDQRGSGTSMGRYSSDKLTIEQNMKDLDLLILLVEELYGDDLSLFLMGHSWGGTLGTGYLLNMNNENKIDGWIEIDGGHNFSADNEAAKRLLEVGNEQINNENSVDFWEEVVDYCNELDTNNISDEEISKINEYSYSAENTLMNDEVITYDISNVTLGEYFGGLIDHYLFSPYNPLTSWTNLRITSSGLGLFYEVTNTDYTDQLYQIDVPTLILWGRYDMVIPVSLGEEAYNLIGTDDKQISIFEKAGHSPMVTHPDDVARQIINFVNRYRN